MREVNWILCCALDDVVARGTRRGALVNLVLVYPLIFYVGALFGASVSIRSEVQFRNENVGLEKRMFRVCSNFVVASEAQGA